MRITGDTFRSILTVGKYSFSKKMKFSNASSTYKFGFSGDSDSLPFVFKSGKVYDPENRLVYSFNELNEISLSGNINTGSYQYYINGNLVCNNGQKNDFLAKKLFYEVDSGSSINVSDFYIRTDADSLDSLSVSFVDDTYFASGNITGNIINGGNSSSVNKVFTGAIAADSRFSFGSSFPFEINPSGQFILSHIGGDAESYNTTLTFTTATGTFSRDITLYRKDSDSEFDYVYGSGEGLVSNTVNSIKENLNLTSLIDTTDSSGNRTFEFNLDYTRKSGSSNVALGKDFSILFSVDAGSYDYSGDINNFVSGVTGFSIFNTAAISTFNTSTQTSSASLAFTSSQNTFYVSLTNLTGSQSFSPYIYYQFSGESTAITGLVSGVSNE